MGKNYEVCQFIVTYDKRPGIRAGTLGNKIIQVDWAKGRSIFLNTRISCDSLLANKILYVKNSFSYYKKIEKFVRLYLFYGLLIYSFIFITYCDLAQSLQYLS